MRGSIMELGGVGPTIVHSDADLENAAQMCIQAGFRLAGQSCASVQNLFVHEDVIGPFTEKMLRRVKALKVGDPKDPASDFGPVIDEAAAQRIVSWVDEARVGGARVLHGGGRNGSLVEPVLITDAREDMKVVCEEVFGPVVVIRPYNDLGSVIQWIRDSGLGLNCGVFTESHAVALRMVRSAPCAAIVVNGTSTFRPEQMPYGGLRNSGYGRESPRDTIRAMTQERILVLP
jgi:acyl-CoA reductase-like NAD-dependent aldehyde dehydrogenase